MRGVACSALLACLGGLLACAEPTAPPLPPGARPFTPEDVYREWWSQIERCSGLTRRFEAVSWYVVPGEDPFMAPGVDQPVIGYWTLGGNRIVLLEWVPNRSALVRHEVLHALLQRPDHPSKYFVDRCGAVINGPGLEQAA
jgi:hypothetical protein